jgi:centrosomal protein CEP104
MQHNLLKHDQSSPLNFKIVACSSEDDKFPIVSLYSPEASRGWCSQQWCEYPQEIVLQFDTLSHITQIQLLSHQYKIATTIELFIGTCPNYEHQEPSYVNAIWKKLGYLMLDPNIKTQYKARELKTVHLDCVGQYLKILLHKCHINENNIYSQVNFLL